jgi:hypothetical protein
VLALEELGGVGGVLDVLDAALDLAHRVASHLAVLGGEERGDLLGVHLEQVLELAHDARALQRSSGSPRRKGLLRRCDRLLDGRLVREQNALLGHAGRGVPHLLRAVRTRVDVLAVDPVTNRGERFGHDDYRCGIGVEDRILPHRKDGRDPAGSELSVSGLSGR